MSDSKGTKGQTNIKRRTFLKVSAAGAAAATLPAMTGCADDEDDLRGGLRAMSEDPETAVLDEVTFALGVQSGAVRQESVILWTLAEDDEPKRLWVWTEEPNGRRVLWADQMVEPNEKYIKVTVDGLSPARDFKYMFFVEDVSGVPELRSTIGAFRTADPPGTLRPITIAASTCTGWRFGGPWHSLKYMAEDDADIDFFVHLGDISYNDNAYRNPAGVVGEEAAAEMDDAELYRTAYRQLWRACLSDEGYRTLLPKTSWYMILDDHEVDDNFNPVAMDQTGLAQALEAYHENLPNERGDDGRIWTSYRWGDTLELFVLDCRTERIPSTREDEDSTYISEEQFRWFTEGVVNSPCRFKVVLNSAPITDMPLPTWQLREDRWDGYDVQRERILNYFEENDVEDLWFLSGDFHVGFVARLSNDSEAWANRVRDIAVGPGGNGPNPVSAGLARGSRIFDEERDMPPSQFEYWDAAVEVATFITFDPEDMSVRVRNVNVGTDRDSDEDNPPRLNEVLLDKKYYFGR